MLGEVDVRGLLHDLAEHVAEWDDSLPLERRLMHVSATMACYGSVRAGHVRRRDRDVGHRRRSAVVTKTVQGVLLLLVGGALLRIGWTDYSNGWSAWLIFASHCSVLVGSLNR